MGSQVISVSVTAPPRRQARQYALTAASGSPARHSASASQDQARAEGNPPEAAPPPSTAASAAASCLRAPSGSPARSSNQPAGSPRSTHAAGPRSATSRTHARRRAAERSPQEHVAAATEGALTPLRRPRATARELPVRRRRAHAPERPRATRSPPPMLERDPPSAGRGTVGSARRDAPAHRQHRASRKRPRAPRASSEGQRGGRPGGDRRGAAVPAGRSLAPPTPTKRSYPRARTW